MATAGEDESRMGLPESPRSLLADDGLQSLHGGGLLLGRGRGLALLGGRRGRGHLVLGAVLSAVGLLAEALGRREAHGGMLLGHRVMGVLALAQGRQLMHLEGHGLGRLCLRRIHIIVHHDGCPAGLAASTKRRVASQHGSARDRGGEEGERSV